MEIRNSKVIVGTAGGTASKNAKTYKVSIPSSWLSKMKIGENNKEILLIFDEDKILIEKRKSFEDFVNDRKSKNHILKMFYYYDKDILCTIICADFTSKELAIKNENVENIHRAFGVKDIPTWDDFMDFLESRCIPKSRDGLRYYLENLGLYDYDPLSIVLKTGGKMAEDHQWMKVEDI